MKTISVFLLLVPCLAFASWKGRVIGVTDGDTVKVLSNETVEVRIRLYGIDAPERRQDFGARSKQYLAGLVAGKDVRVEPFDTDRYGRTVALIFADGKCANEAMIRAGMAWVYGQYCTADFCTEWKRLEAEARSNRAGLWTASTQQAPWDFRHAQAEETERQAARDAKPISQVIAWLIIIGLSAGILALIRLIQNKRYIKRKRENPDSKIR